MREEGLKNVIKIAKSCRAADGQPRLLVKNGYLYLFVTGCRPVSKWLFSGGEGLEGAEARGLV